MGIKEIRNFNGDLRKLVCETCILSEDRITKQSAELLVPVNSIVWNKHQEEIEKNINDFKEKHSNCNERNISNSNG